MEILDEGVLDRALDGNEKTLDEKKKLEDN